MQAVTIVERGREETGRERVWEGYHLTSLFVSKTQACSNNKLCVSVCVCVCVCVRVWGCV